MKNIAIDGYVKFLLTVIAVCLSILTLQQSGLFPAAQANSAYDRQIPPRYGLIPLNADGSITVKLSAHNELDVNITGIETSDELDVNIDEIGGGFISSGGPLPVREK